MEAFDIALLLLATLRVTRFITTDSLGQWWFYAPLAKRVYRKTPPGTWSSRYLEGLTCPFCVGFWIGAVGIASLLVAGGPGGAAVWWRVLAGVFALNWVVGHAARYLD